MHSMQPVDSECIQHSQIYSFSVHKLLLYAENNIEIPLFLSRKYFHNLRTQSIKNQI